MGKRKTTKRYHFLAQIETGIVVIKLILFASQISRVFAHSTELAVPVFMTSSCTILGNFKLMPITSCPPLQQHGKADLSQSHGNFPSSQRGE
jgi:hypothetical protein